ncbi:WG repeat-containing protein [Oceanirhabdus seepicola]|uniref:WG repeat-containing protein n=1 Tax=Oceanirhabdus seepicola TaxID=2828781 RepID=A0A9J6P2T2_9CLOT|nr:WG repeat-containing protein [Oceanirhabdus seepicola]MCM1989832.1 WG repeat-containing protein [Oceanirhabdus seepicola]
MKNVKIKKLMFLFFIQVFLIFDLCSCTSSEPSNKKSLLLNSVKEETTSIEDAKDIPLALVKYDGKWGVIDQKGTWVVEPNLDYKKVLPPSEGLALAQSSNGKWGFIDKMGDWVIEPKFNPTHGELGVLGFNEGVAFICINGNYGLIDTKGEWIIEPKFFDAYSFSEGLANVYLSEQGYFYINKEGEEVLKLEDKNAYDVISYFSEGLLLRENDNWKVGFINKQGQWVIEAKFDRGSKFSEELAGVEYEGTWGFIDNTGDWAIKPKYDSVSYFKEGLAAVEVNNKYGIINKNGQWIIKPKHDYIEMIDGYSEGMISVKINNKYGYLNKNGELAIKAKFDLTSAFSNNLAIVKSDEKYGYIDKEGNYVIKPIFELAFKFID